jgi:hypothetical protein
VQVYVAGSLADVARVRAAQLEVEAAGHSVILDWTRGADAALTDYASAPSVAETIAEQDLRAVLEADAVVGLDTSDSVFYFHPAVRIFESVEDWLRSL